MDRQDTRVKVFEGERYNNGWPPERAIEFVAWLNERLAQIPVDYMGSARVEIGSTQSYGDDYATIEISYIRPETDEEVAERYAAQRQRLDQDEQWARQRLAEIEHRRTTLK